jgi:hypothetical protein
MGATASEVATCLFTAVDTGDTDGRYRVCSHPWSIGLSRIERVIHFVEVSHARIFNRVAIVDHRFALATGTGLLG